VELVMSSRAWLVAVLVHVSIACVGCQVLTKLEERSCSPGARRCKEGAPSQIEVCSSDGQRIETVTCSASSQSVCAEGRCVACLPGPDVCKDAFTTRHCSPKFEAEDQACVPPRSSCVSGHCVALERPHLFAGGDHTCFIGADQTVSCWGKNTSAEVGTGAASDAGIDRPHQVLDGGVPLKAITLALGYHHSCALLPNATVKCWGGNEPAGSPGSLGVGSASKLVVDPTPVLGLTNVVAIASGSYHTCALTAEKGEVLCWGANGLGTLSGVLGTGSSADVVSEPERVTGIQGVTEIVAGGIHSCARLETGWRCWGASQCGQVGDGGTTCAGDENAAVAFTPVVIKAPILLPEPFARRSLTLGRFHSCSADISDVQCWGSNYRGQLGRALDEDPALAKVPGPVIGLAEAVAKQGDTIRSVVSGQGSYHTCALLTKGAVVCWGDNVCGQLARPATMCTTASLSLLRDPMPDPQVVMNGPDVLNAVREISLGGRHTCALMQADDEILCWGHNQYGQLGAGNTDLFSSVPVKVLR
jgi:alpha-tubulin suppressor-like RCC1 family protein